MYIDYNYYIIFTLFCQCSYLCINLEVFETINLKKGLKTLIYFWAFVVGGALCVIGQLLIDYTKLTPARILVSYVVIGVVLHALGVYDHLVELAGAGATVPLTGFGNSIAMGVEKAIGDEGFLGIFTGGLAATAGGITAAIIFSYIIALIFKPKAK